MSAESHRGMFFLLFLLILFALYLFRYQVVDVGDGTVYKLNRLTGEDSIVFFTPLLGKLEITQASDYARNLARSASSQAVREMPDESE